ACGEHARDGGAAALLGGGAAAVAASGRLPGSLQERADLGALGRLRGRALAAAVGTESAGEERAGFRRLRGGDRSLYGGLLLPHLCRVLGGETGHRRTHAFARVLPAGRCPAGAVTRPIARVGARGAVARCEPFERGSPRIGARAGGRAVALSRFPTSSDRGPCSMAGPRAPSSPPRFSPPRFSFLEAPDA